jgi:hypothetical protein
MASGSAAERAEAGGKEAARHRGQTMVLTFSMQVHAEGVLGGLFLCGSGRVCGAGGVLSGL